MDTKHTREPWRYPPRINEVKRSSVRAPGTRGDFLGFQVPATLQEWIREALLLAPEDALAAARVLVDVLTTDNVNAETPDLEDALLSELDWPEIMTYPRDEGFKQEGRQVR
jgi:hypothetical protein